MVESTDVQPVVPTETEQPVEQTLQEPTWESVPEETRTRWIEEHISTADHETLSKQSPAYNKQIQRSQAREQRRQAREVEERTERRRVVESRARQYNQMRVTNPQQFANVMQDPRNAQDYYQTMSEYSSLGVQQGERERIASDMMEGFGKTITETVEFDGIPYKEIAEETKDPVQFFVEVAKYGAEKMSKEIVRETEKRLEASFEAKMNEFFAKVNAQADQPSDLPPGSAVPQREGYTQEELGEISIEEFRANRAEILARIGYK